MKNKETNVKAKIIMTDLLDEAEVESEILKEVGNIKTLVATNEE